MWCDVGNKMLKTEVLKILKYVKDLIYTQDLGKNTIIFWKFLNNVLFLNGNQFIWEKNSVDVVKQVILGQFFYGFQRSFFMS